MPDRLPWRLIGMLAGLIALVVIPALIVRSCDKRHARAAQSRVERSQAGAAANSAADAIGTVSNAGAREAGSEDLTRDNDRDIRAAAGANDPVNPAARDAGIAALCKRPSYANDPRCHRNP